MFNLNNTRNIYMALILGAYGVVTGVLAACAANEIGKMLGHKTISFCSTHKSYKEQGQFFGTSALGSLVTFLHNNPFTVALKFGMTATSCFLTARDFSHITREELLKESCGVETEEIKEELLWRSTIGKPASVFLGAATIAVPIWGQDPMLQCISYFASNGLAYVIARRTSKDASSESLV